MTTKADAFLRPAGSFFAMETRVYMRTPLAIFWTFIYPVALFFILDAIFGGGSSPGNLGLSYADYLISGLSVMTVFSVSLFSLMAVLVEQRASGSLLGYATLPVEKTAFFLGFVGSRMVILIVFCILYILALSLLVPNATLLPAGRLAGIAAYLAAGAFVFFGISLNLASWVSSTTTVHALANIINLPVIFLSDLFLPVDLFPPGFARILKLLPTYQFVHGVRALYAGKVTLLDLAPQIVVMVVAGVVLAWVAGRHFRWWQPE